MRRNNKMLLLAAGCISLSIAIAGCGGPTNENENVNTNNSSETAPTADSSIVNEATAGKEDYSSTASVVSDKPIIEPLITKDGGLGDTKEAIEQIRGASENREDATFSSYQNDKFVILYVEDEVKKNTAINVTLQFEFTDIPRRSKKEALLEASTVIPSDAVKVKEYKADEDRYVIQYESKLLAGRLEGFYDLHKDDHEFKPGTFIVLLKHDEQGFFSVVVGAGDKP